MATVRSERRLYKIPEIEVNRGTAADPVLEPIIVKMKRTHGELLGLTPLLQDDPLWIGTYASGPNQGESYQRNFGGYRELPFTLVAETEFDLESNLADGTGTETTQWKSITIGFPAGATVNKVFSWIIELEAVSQIAALITPSGRRIPLDDAGDTP